MGTQTAVVAHENIIDWPRLERCTCGGGHTVTVPADQWREERTYLMHDEPSYYGRKTGCKHYYKNGRLVKGVTELGVSYTIDSRVDQYNRGTPHAIFGTSPVGRAVTIGRNYSPGDVLQMANSYAANGYTQVHVGIDGCG